MKATNTAAMPPSAIRLVHVAMLASSMLSLRVSIRHSVAQCHGARNSKPEPTPPQLRLQFLLQGVIEIPSPPKGERAG
jgi:hypothetical protein